MIETYKNRYGYIYTFTLQPDGDVVWEGDFRHCRFGYPNDYSLAFDMYRRDGGTLDKEQFIENILRPEQYDDCGNTVSSGIFNSYGQFVTSDASKIGMVDPSGGPYMSEGMTILGRKIQEFRPYGDGYLIVTNK